MKLIHVYGDDDYGVLNFENSELGKKSYKEVYDFVEKHGGSYQNEEEDFCIDNYEFENVKVTDEFILFLQEEKDYDSAKHKDWFIVDE